MIIYQIENKLNNKIYIGQTKRRLKSRLKGHMKSKSYIGCALRKYGIENFDIQIIDHAETKDELNEKEIYWIKTLDCKDPNGYNLTDGGEGVFDSSGLVGKKISRSKIGHEVLEETKRKISEKLKGQKLSDETKLKISENHSKHNLGKHHSEETKQKIKEKRKNQVITEETKQKISQSEKGRKLSEETKQKISISKKGKQTGRPAWNKGLTKSTDSRVAAYSESLKNSENINRTPWNKGKKGIYSEETLKKMGESQKKRFENPEQRKNSNWHKHQLINTARELT